VTRLIDVLVLAHGFHLEAENWHGVVWGDPVNGVYGRVPRAVQVVLKNKHPCLLIGSGGSVNDGKTEADVAYDYLLDHFHEIPELYSCGDGGYEYVQHITQLERVAKNTAQEVKAVMELCIEKDVQELVLVSSPTHISRCLLEAEKLRMNPQFKHLCVSAVASDTSYAGYGPEDVVVIEPPHRGDMPQVPFHENAKDLFQFLRDEKIAMGFNGAWRALIEHWRLKLPKE
tara:strand:+ start:167 stop:853 length:687 start_codon:yes stop_codon:yes gene_type:complete